MKKTKIIASLGPSTSDYQVIFNMIDLGVDVFQINLNYLSFKECNDLIKKIREASLKLDKIIGIMLDIPGPSIRLDKLKEEKVFLPLNKEIRLYNYHVVCNNTQLSTDYQNLVELVKLDDVIVLGAGNVKLKVIDINADNFICKVIDAGYIESNQPVHIKGASLKLPFLNENDQKNILYAIKNDVDFLALSYVRDEQDILSVVDLLIENGNDHISLIAKIENEYAYSNLEEILKVSDGVLVARGDLGLNVSIEKLPFYQKEIIKMANRHQKIGLVGTDLLKSMRGEKKPSKSEVLDIYNAVLDKVDGLVLGAETAIGENPIACLEVMERIIFEAENNFPYKENLEKTFAYGNKDITSTIAYSVVDAGINLNASCILANTMSGYTARKISYFRPKSPILGLSPNINTVKSLTLNYGIIPVLVKKYDATDDIIKECINKYKEIMDYKIGDIVIITGGLPLNNKNTDFMKIEKIS